MRGVRPNSPVTITRTLRSAARVEVFDQRRHRLIEDWEAVPQRLEDVLIDGMVVPVRHPTTQWAIESGRDDLHACFYQTAGHQALLPPLMPAIPITHVDRL